MHSDAITAKERGILRELAKQQAEIAALPVMAERETLWYDLNDGLTRHPLVTMEFHGPAHEVYPPLACENPLARALETQMARQIFKYLHYRDDRVIPAHVTVGVPNWVQPFGYRPKSYNVKNPDGTAGFGYMFDHAIHDLEADFDVFQPSKLTVDAGLVQANQAKAQAEDVLGDILPVRLEGTPLFFSPAHNLIRMMSMETLFCSILDYPDLFHRMMRRLTDDMHAYMDALERGSALVPANGATRIAMDTYCYSRELPDHGAPRPLTMKDMWGYTNFQETVGMSVPMFDEFFFAYTLEVSERCGLYSYGCCEPVHTLWEPCLSRMKNLRKVSVSAWCDEEYIGEAIRGKKIVYHRKPFPNLISVDSVFDEDAFKKHLTRTIKAARGCPLEVTFRDVSSVCGEPWRLTRAVELTREVFAESYQG